jgi:formylglycine-generating enzyme required for sulfatase activity
LFQAGCGQFKSQGKTVVITLSPNVKMRLVYIEALKIFVGKYEVSNGEFRCFRPAHSSGAHEGLSLNADNQPVVNISWNDARAFCDWLTKNHGTTSAGSMKFRLPKEKEWETYATCGTGSEYPWGDGPTPKHYNYYGRENRSSGQMLDNSDGYRVSAPVKKSGENDWGLYGIGGNVWEWCEDKDEEMPSMRVMKGASWADCAPLFLRTARRSAYDPGYKYVNLGFRVVADPADVPPSPSDQSKPAKKNESSGE